MDFTTFIPREMIGPLTWLGRRDWIEYGDIPDRRSVWARTKKVIYGDRPLLDDLSISNLVAPPWLRKEGNIVVSEDEKRKYHADHWRGVQVILSTVQRNVVNCFWHLALGKCLAEGPKIFKATTEQCQDLEDHDLSFPFNDYHSPFPTFIMEIPTEYKQRLARLYKLQSGPSHVICHHEKGRIITVSAFFNRNNIITHITPNRAEYTSLEDAIITNRDNTTGIDSPDHEPLDFQAAEVVQRLCLNFGMYMTLIGAHVSGPYNPKEYQKQKQLLRSNKPRKAELAKQLLASTVYLIAFDQVVKLNDNPSAAPQNRGAEGVTGRTVGFHRRRGHWRYARVGPKAEGQRKWIPVKPCTIHPELFVGDQKDISTTYEFE